MFHRVLVSATVVAVFACSVGSAKAQIAASDSSLLPLTNNSADGTHATTPEGSISGSIWTEDNTPINNARVEIREISTGLPVAYGYTGVTGSFELNNVHSGSYEVIATSGINEAREQVQMGGLPVQVTMHLPHTSQNVAQGQQTVSVQSLVTPEKARNALDKARGEAAKGRLDAALHEIAKALTIDPRYSDAVAFRGVVELQTGNLAEASNDLQQAIQLDNKNAMAYVAMGALYNQQSKFDQALRELERGEAINPAAWQVHYEISKAHLGKGDFATALKEVNKAQGLVGQDYTPLFLLKGQALLGVRDYPAAAAELQKFLDQEGNGPTADQVRQVMAHAKASAEAHK